MSKAPKKKKPSPLSHATSVPALPAVQKIFISDPKNLVTHVREDGLVETMDSATGMVVALSHHEHLAADLTKGTTLDKILPRGFVEMDYNGKTIVFDQSIDPAALTHKNYELSPVTKDIIFQRIAEGDSLAMVAKRRGMPPYTLLLRFYMRDSDFRELVDTAKKFRAESIYEKIMHNVDRLENEPMNKAEVDALTNATNFRKWTAEISDPHGYGNRKDPNTGGVTIIVSTGIDRSQNENTIEIKVDKKDG